MSKIRITKNSIDVVLGGSVLLLMVAGLLMVFSASSIVGNFKFGSLTFFFSKQIIWGILSLLLMSGFSHMDYKWYKKARIPLLGILVTLILLSGLYFFGYRVNGATRWYSISGFRFQPSEMAKITIILYVAYFLSTRGKNIQKIGKGLLPLLLVLGLVIVLIMFQPDFSTSVMIGILAGSMLFISKMKLRHIFGIILLLAPFAILLLQLKGYQLYRIESWLAAWQDPASAAHQIKQSLIGLGKGGLFGQGIGNSTQKFFFLPESHTDFIFSIIGEEFGFIGTSTILFLFLVIFIRGVRIANRTSDPFGKYLAIGITLNIVLFAFINAAVVSMLVPVTGLSMPFLSYGGSNLLFLGISVGVLLNISRQTSTGEQNWNEFPEKREQLYNNLIST